MNINLPQLGIKTRRTVMRPLLKEDVAHLLALHSDPSTKHFAWVDHLQNRKEIQLFIKEQKLLYASGLGLWAIESKSNQDFLGICGLRQRNDLNGIIDISYRIMPEKRRKGYGTETAGKLVEFAFLNIGLAEVYAQVHHLNAPSRRIMYRLGFKTEPKQKSDKWLLYKRVASV